MNKLSRIAGLLIYIGLSTAYAASPITVINNTKFTIEMKNSYCNQSGMCTYLNKSNIDARGTSNNTSRYIYPMGMDIFNIDSASAYDDNQKLIAKLANNCFIKSSTHHSIVLDTYGTSEIFCMYI
jgi:hypothetical protein